ncbi:MAG: ATP-dependent metallopeptidase FtsH/Yme1/Tma family protein, partial [Acidobacteria bacterium]|nr:ATP-dependent metallopeptidase FtsH/Yme1/Tma family protein [Acidobacteriota bacterium]
MNSSTLKTLFLWMAIFLMVVFLWKTFQTNKGRTQEITYTEFSDQVDKGDVAEVTIRGKEVEGKYTEGASHDDLGTGFRLELPFDSDSAFIDRLQAAKVKVTAEEPKDNMLAVILFNYAPIILIVGLWIFFMRQ